MTNFTKKAIKEAFDSLLEERPLSNITIKDIVAKCGINRNSFYYHYQDLPALIEEIIKEEAESIIEKYPSVSTIVECFDALVDFASHRKKAIMHIYRSVNREVFERNMMNISEYFVKEYVDTVVSEEISETTRKTIVNYYKCVCFGLALDWLNKGMTDEYAHEIRHIFIVMKDHAKDMALMLQQ